jgi:hypothetical protein
MIKNLPIEIEENETFQSLFTKTGALALEHHDDLIKLVGNKESTLDSKKGIITFGNNLEFPIQILGTLSIESHKWHWAWDNKDIGFPEELIEESIKVREFGEEYNILQFKENLFEASVLEAHLIAMTVSALFGDDSYFVVDFDEILFIVTIKSDKIKHEKSVKKFLYTFDTFQKEFDVSPRLAFEGYTKISGYEYKERDDFSVAKIDQSRVIVGISEKGNVTHIQTLLG